MSLQVLAFFCGLKFARNRVLKFLLPFMNWNVVIQKISQSVIPSNAVWSTNLLFDLQWFSWHIIAHSHLDCCHITVNMCIFLPRYSAVALQPYQEGHSSFYFHLRSLEIWIIWSLGILKAFRFAIWIQNWNPFYCSDLKSYSFAYKLLFCSKKRLVWKC